MIDEAMKLVPHDAMILARPVPEFEFNEEVNAAELGNALAQFMLDNGGIGLAANQVGLSHRMFVMRTHPEVTIVINPRLVDHSHEQVVLEEGCLSYPGLHVKVKRPAHIRVRFQDHTGAVRTEKYTGLAARVFLHELDHLNGLDFLNRAGPLARQRALERWKKLNKKKERKLNAR